MHGFLKSVLVHCTEDAGYIPNKLQRDVKLSGDRQLLEPEIKRQFHLYPCTRASLWFHLPGR